MTAIAQKWFRGYELGSRGLVTPQVSGIFGSPDVDTAETIVPGRSVPSITVVRRKVMPVRMKCIVSGEDHFQLVAKLSDLASILDPEQLWGEFGVENRPGERTYARVLGWPVGIDWLPYKIRMVEFDLSWERYPWWEDENAHSLTLTGATLTGTATNNGSKEAFPTYTCTVTDNTLTTGLTITVGSDVFTYTGALVTNDVLVVTTDEELPDVTLNGTRDFANTSASATFPTLAVGANTVTKSNDSFDLVVSWRDRRD